MLSVFIYILFTNLDVKSLDEYADLPRNHWRCLHFSFTALANDPVQPWEAAGDLLKSQNLNRFDTKIGFLWLLWQDD